MPTVNVGIDIKAWAEVVPAAGGGLPVGRLQDALGRFTRNTVVAVICFGRTMP